MRVSVRPSAVCTQATVVSRCVCVCERSEWHARLFVRCCRECAWFNCFFSDLSCVFFFFFFIAYACKNLGKSWSSKINFKFLYPLTRRVCEGTPCQKDILSELRYCILLFIRYHVGTRLWWYRWCHGELFLFRFVFRRTNRKTRHGNKFRSETTLSRGQRITDIFKTAGIDRDLLIDSNALVAVHIIWHIVIYCVGTPCRHRSDRESFPLVPRWAQTLLHTPCRQRTAAYGFYAVADESESAIPETLRATVFDPFMYPTTRNPAFSHTPGVF